MTCNRNWAAPSPYNHNHWLPSVRPSTLKMTLKASISSRWSLTWRPHTRTWPVQTEKLLKKKNLLFCRESIFKFNYGCNVITEGRQCRPGSLFLHYGCLRIVCSFGEALSISVWIYKETPPPPFFLILTTRVRTKTMSNALSSVERKSCIWKPTTVQISHTPPTGCLTFRFGRKNFFFWFV